MNTEVKHQVPQQATAEVHVINGLPVYSKSDAMRSTKPCLAAVGSGLYFIHDPERRDRLAAFT